jgi:cytochrome c oxidase cbb3-type subunit III
MRTAVWILLAQPALWAAGTGETLFLTHCAPCHGAHGEGGRGAKLAVRRLPRAPDDAALAAIVATGIPGTQMPATRMTADESMALVAYVRSLGRTQAERVPGDSASGKRLFEGKGGCLRCHTVGGNGGRLGPDLSEIGAKRGPEYLRTALVAPEAEVPENFASYRKLIYTPDNFLWVRLVTRDGKSVAGVRVDEDTFTIQIRDASDRLYSFRKDELREMHEDWGKSPMPSYRDVFSASELQDVVAYLSSLQGPS